MDGTNAIRRWAQKHNRSGRNAYSTPSSPSPPYGCGYPEDRECAFPDVEFLQELETSRPGKDHHVYAWTERSGGAQKRPN